MLLQLGDALWRAQSAGVRAADSPAGLVVCGMGGSAIGGDLAIAALGDRATRPISVVRLRARILDSARDSFCALSYSGRPRSSFAAGAAGARRAALTGGTLAEVARAEGVPVVGVPSGMQPRAAVVYGTVATLECAALCGAGPSLHAEIDTATALPERLVEVGGRARPTTPLAKRIARELAGTVPVIHGSGSSEAVARRWHTQITENVKTSAFWSELPEANHHEICGWERGPARAPYRPCSRTTPTITPRGPAHRPDGRRGGAGRRAHGAGGRQRARAASSAYWRRCCSVDLVSVYMAVLEDVDSHPDRGDRPPQGPPGPEQSKIAEP